MDATRHNARSGFKWNGNEVQRAFSKYDEHGARDRSWGRGVSPEVSAMMERNVGALQRDISDGAAAVIRKLGYTVKCGLWEDVGHSLSTGNWTDESDKLLASQANNYVIFSIRRASGEYVYGSAESPTSLGRDTCGELEMNECRWSPDEVERRWPLSGHKSLPHYLMSHKEEMAIGPDRKFIISERPYYRGKLCVSDCGPDGEMEAGEFARTFYLTKRRSTRQKRHVEQLIRDGVVRTIANTLPDDIVGALRNLCRNNAVHWEFMTPYTEALPCAEDVVHEEDDSVEEGGSAAEVGPMTMEYPKEDDSSSSSEEED